MISKKIRHPLVEMTVARLKETIREPEAMFWIFVFPILFAIGLGIAFRDRPPEKLPVAIDQRMSDAAKVSQMIAAGSNLKPVLISPAQAGQNLRTGKIALVVSHDPKIISAKNNAADALKANGLGPDFFLIFDPTRPESQLARLAVSDALQAGAGRKDSISLQDEKVTEPGSRYIDYLIPGLVGMNLMGSGMWGVGFAIVFARTRKLLKRYAATPMRRSHYLLAFMFSRLMFLVWEVGMVVACGWIFFNVKVYGSILDLILISIIGSMTFAGMGLLVASRATTIEAASGWMNFIMLPMYLLSGGFFSYTRFPAFLIPFIRALPLTALNDAMRAVINEGLPLFHSWLEILVLIAWALVSFTVALKIFRWQ